jgi:hypothetical protein
MMTWVRNSSSMVRVAAIIVLVALAYYGLKSCDGDDSTNDKTTESSTPLTMADIPSSGVYADNVPEETPTEESVTAPNVDAAPEPTPEPDPIEVDTNVYPERGQLYGVKVDGDNLSCQGKGVPFLKGGTVALNGVVYGTSYNGDSIDITLKGNTIPFESIIVSLGDKALAFNLPDGVRDAKTPVTASMHLSLTDFSELAGGETVDGFVLTLCPTGS